MRLQTIDIRDLQAPAQLLVQSRGVFSSLAWANLYNGQNKLVGIFNDNQELIGSFNMFVFKKYGLTVIINPPFTPHINLHYINPAQTPSTVNSFNKQVMQAIADFLVDTKAHFIKLNFAGSIVDTQAFSWKHFQVSNRFTYILDLSLSEEALYANLSSEKKKSLRKAEKDGLTVEEANDYNVVFGLIEQSLTRNGKFRNEAIIRNIILHFSDSNNSIAFIARDANRQPIAAAYCIRTAHKAYYLFGGFDEANKHHGAGVSCMWACIRKAKSTGLQEFDFEGSMVPEIEKYFREFGGELKPLQEISFKRFPYKQLSSLISR